MNIFNFFKKKNALSIKIKESESKMKDVVKSYFDGYFWIYQYGSVEIDPKNLVFWICVNSDIEKRNLEDSDLKDRLRQVLSENDYPAEAIPYVHIGFESQETVDRESNGNWYHHFK